MDHPDYDVAVIGAGGAGMSAALTAASDGARVVLVEAGDQVGGSTVLSGGVFYAAGTHIQRQMGFTDSAEAMYRYYMAVNRHDVVPDLVRKLCEESADTLNWLIALGVDYRPEGLYYSGAEEIPRGHKPVGLGASIVAALDAALGKHPVDVALRTRVTALITDSSGQVCGFRSGSETISAGAVVLTTGGFGSNPEKLQRYFPDAASAGDWTWYIGSKGSQGEGLDLGQSVGADIVGFNRGLVLLTDNFAHDVQAQLPAWLLFATQGGHRFVNESTNMAIVVEMVLGMPGRQCFGIFDEDSRLACHYATERNPSYQCELLASLADSGKLIREVAQQNKTNL